uniref:Uncharacterized protein n=1 Tax=Magallana gigas TaxID=29159 RepID=K1Q989_MAGGI
MAKVVRTVLTGVTFTFPSTYFTASSSRDDDLFSDEDVMSYTYWNYNQLWTLALSHAA